VHLVLRGPPLFAFLQKPSTASSGFSRTRVTFGFSYRFLSGFSRGSSFVAKLIPYLYLAHSQE
jgi:hypothetical protein